MSHRVYQNVGTVLGLMVAIWVGMGSGGSSLYAQHIHTATTSVNITICGDGIVHPGQVCDDGVNTGEYATSTATRNCLPDCSGFGPYCGDGILQTLFGETCDDGNNIDGDGCDAQCQQEVPPSLDPGGTGTPGGGGGGSSPGGGATPGGARDGSIAIDRPTRVTVGGIAYPGARVTLLVDGVVAGVIEANSAGVFQRTFDDLTPGPATFGFWALDSAQRRSITFSSTFEVIQGAMTTVTGIIIPPTIEAVPDRVSLGTPIVFRGSAAPNALVSTFLNRDMPSATTTSATTGAWEVTVPTNTLTNESFHTVRARYRSIAGARFESGFSQALNFYVGEREAGGTISPDINQDGRVDLVDFSILLFNWGTSNPIADFNQDGIVDLADFSIMLFNWTG